MSYGSVYVARIAMGASDAQTVKAFHEAEAYPGPSLIIAYSHCIAHGINMTLGMQQQKLAVGEAATGRCCATSRPAKATATARSGCISIRSRRAYAWKSTPTGRPATACSSRATRKKRSVLMELARRDVDERWRRLQDMAASPREETSKGE